MKPEIKMEDKAELEVLKSFLEHIKGLLGDEEAMGDAPVEIEITSVEPVDGEDMEEAVEEQLDLPKVDDEVDTGEQLDEVVEEGAEDDLDLDALKSFIGRG